MRLSVVKEQDIVQCNIRGEVFYGLVIGHEAPGLLVNRIGRPMRRSVTARQVTGHWRKSGASRSRKRMEAT